MNKTTTTYEVVLDLNTAMDMCGWREPFLSEYEVNNVKI